MAKGNGGHHTRFTRKDEDARHETKDNRGVVCRQLMDQ